MNKVFMPMSINNKINPLFVKANAELLNKHKFSFHSDLNANEKSTLLETLWKEEYNASIEKVKTSSVLTTDKWSGIWFSNETHYSLFMLRWS